MDEQFQLLFDKMKMELNNQTTELKKSITDSIMERMEEKLEPIIAENKQLKTKVESLERELDYLKREKKSNNVIIFGLKEEEKSKLELLQKIKLKLNDNLSIKLEDYEVNKIHRIGKTSINGKPRPVLLSFVSGWKKGEVMKNKKYLEEIYITEDYSKEVLEKRKALQPQLIEERNKGNMAYIKYDRLIVKENNINKEKRKREPSTSPHENLRKQFSSQSSSKNNRTNAFDLMRARSRSNSLSLPQSKQ